MCCCGGCATAPTAGAHDAPGPDPTFDPARALLPLSRVAPDPPAPEHPAAAVAELSASSVRRLSRAMERFRQQRFTEASLELEKALRHDPDHPRLHRALARTLFATGNVERVRAHLRKAVSVDGDDIVSHYLLGRLAYGDGRNDDAIREYRVALKCSNAATEGAYVPATSFHLARVLNAEGYLTAAIEMYRAYERSVAALGPDARGEPELASLLQINGGRAGGPISVAYEKLGRFAEAADALAASIRDRAADADTRERLVRLLSRSGRNEEALDEARKLLDDPSRAVGLLAEIHERAGHPEAVVEDVRRLFDAHPDRSDLLTAYVDVLSRFDRLGEAERVLREAASRRPGEVAVYWRLCDVYRKLRNWSGAIGAAADALRADPELHSAARDKAQELGTDAAAAQRLLEGLDSTRVAGLDYAEAFLLGVTALGAERRDQALSLFRRAMEDRPGFVPARVELAQILLDRYRWQDVIEMTCKDGDGIETDGRLERLCGQAYAGLDDFEKAESHLSAAISLNRTDTAAMWALAELLRDHREPHRAQRQYEALLAVNPLHEASREALFEVFLFTLDRRADATSQLAELRRLAASPHRIARCQARLDLGLEPKDEDWEAYRKRLTEAIEQSGPDAKTIEMIAQSYLAQDLPEQALQTLDSARGVDRDATEFLVSRAQVYRRLLDYPHAIETMERLLRRHPNRVSWIDWQLERLTEDHRYDEVVRAATEQLERPNRTEEDNKKYRIHLVDALQRAKRFDEELGLIRGWMAEQPDDALWPQLLIDVLKAAERFDEAIAAARARYADRSDAAARDEVWLAYMAAERYVPAEQLLLSALEDDPENERLVRFLVQTLMLADRHDDALELVHNLRHTSRSASGVAGLEAAVLQHGGRHDAAIKIWSKRLREAEAEGPDNPRIAEFRAELADAMIRAMRLEEAAAKLKRWIDVTQSPVARFEFLGRLSNCHQFLGDTDAALAALQRQFDLREEVRSLLRPGTANRMNVGVHNDFGYSLADAGRRLDEARRLIRFALTRRPQVGAYLDSYGWVLYKSGAFAESVRWLEKAVDTPDGEDAVVYDHLGDAQWRLGNTDRAVRRWRKAIELIDKALETLDRPDHRRLRVKIKAKLAAHAAGKTPETAPLAPAKADVGIKTERRKKDENAAPS